MSKIWNVIQKLFRRTSGRGRSRSMAGCSMNGNGKLKHVQAFQENHRIVEVRRRQIKGAMDRLDVTIRQFSNELVIIAKTNGHGK